MSNKERDANAGNGDHQKSTPATHEKKRPYRAPRVESYPLFERMALNCDPGMKNTGEDNES